jgi:hypothetical protein
MFNLLPIYRNIIFVTHSFARQRDNSMQVYTESMQPTTFAIINAVKIIAIMTITSELLFI